MSDTVARMLRRQLRHAFAASRWQVEGLSDDEYFWEPEPTSWSVRRRGEARSAQPSGAGPWVIDGEWPLERPPPVTTLAWRLVHLAAWTEVYRDWTFGDARLAYAGLQIAGTAGDAVAWLHHARDAFAAEVSVLTDEDLDTLRPTHYGAMLPIGLLVWQIAVEHLHHSAEMGVLRDLRRGHGRADWWPEPVDADEP